MYFKISFRNNSLIKFSYILLRRFYGKNKKLIFDLHLLKTVTVLLNEIPKKEP